MDTQSGSVVGLTSSVVGVFDDSQQADRALEQLRAVGLGPDDVSVMMRDAGTVDEIVEQTAGSPVAGGASAGATIGGLLGGLAGWMVAAGAIAIPGVGMVVGAGALATTLAGLALGAATGGIIGGLLGLGVPEEEAKTYEGHVREGRVLVTVHPRAGITSERAQEIMQANGGYDVRVYGAASDESLEQDNLFPGSPVDRDEYANIYDEETGQYVPYSQAVASVTSQASVGEGERTVAAETDAPGAGAEGGTGSGEPLALTEESRAEPIPASRPLWSPAAVRGRTCLHKRCSSRLTPLGLRLQRIRQPTAEGRPSRCSQLLNWSHPLPRRQVRVHHWTLRRTCPHRSRARLSRSMRPLAKRPRRTRTSHRKNLLLGLELQVGGLAGWQVGRLRALSVGERRTNTTLVILSRRRRIGGQTL